MGVVVKNSPPNLLQLNKQFNRCYNDPDQGPLCPWLSMAGLTLTAILTVYHLNGSLLIGKQLEMFKPKRELQFCFCVQRHTGENDVEFSGLLAQPSRGCGRDGLSRKQPIAKVVPFSCFEEYAPPCKIEVSASL